MTSKVPIYDLKGGFASTFDLDLAMANNYIGEIHAQPTQLAIGMGKVFGKRYGPATIYFYGTPDEELRRWFGLQGNG